MRRNNYDYSYTDYNVDVLMLKDPKVLRREYSKLRSVAVKRLKRMAEYGYTQSSTFKYFNQYKVMPPLKDIPEKNKGILARSLSDVMRFLSIKTSTISGIKEYRKEKIVQMRSHNYDVTEENFDAFVSYMSGVRAFNKAFGLSESLGSPKEAEAFFTIWNEFYDMFGTS